MYINKEVADRIKRDEWIANILEDAYERDQARLREQMQTLAKPVEQKVVDAIWYLSCEGQTRLPSQSIIAFQAHTNRPSVNQIIQKLIQRGYLNKVTGKRDLHITPKGKDSLPLISLGLNPGIARNSGSPEDESTEYTTTDNGFHVPSSYGFKTIDFSEESSGDKIIERLRGNPAVRIREFPKNKPIFSEGTISPDYHFVAKGLVLGYSEDSSGRRYNGAIFRGPSVCGEAYSSKPVRHNMRCDAYTDVKILQIDRSRVGALLPESLILRDVIDAALESDGIYNSWRSKMQGLQFLDQRVAAVLLDIKERIGLSDISLNQDEIALLAEAARSATNKQLAILKKRGIIHHPTRYTIRLSNEGELRKIAGIEC